MCEIVRAGRVELFPRRDPRSHVEVWETETTIALQSYGNFAECPPFLLPEWESEQLF